jgi:hypothetical protein
MQARELFYVSGKTLEQRTSEEENHANTAWSAISPNFAVWRRKPELESRRHRNR